MEFKRNLSMLMDFYELTMSNGYFLNDKNKEIAVFDLFYRNNPDNAAYSIFVGINDVIDYINNLHFDDSDIEYLRKQNIFNEEFLVYLRNFTFKGDIYSFPEGSVVYPHEPLITVVAPLIDCQLIETALLLIVNHETLIATKTNRIVLSAKGRGVSDFGARRAHNADSAIFGAKASYIGGASSTATTLAGKMFDIPVSGTMAHSWIMSFDNEYDAFLAYAKIYPTNCVLLLDTYNVLKSGVKNAIKVAKDYLIPNGYRLKGIRIDSGDLAYLSKKVREELDNAGLNDCLIVVSNSLDEYKIQSLLLQGAKIDSFGVGENLITAKSNPVFGGVYKLAAIKKDDEFIPKIKMSETVEKITNPAFKDVYRIFDKEDKAIADVLTLHNEKLDIHKRGEIIDPLKTWKTFDFDGCYAKNMRVKVFENGKQIYTPKDIKTIRKELREFINNSLWDEEKRFINPHIHYLDFSKSLYDLKMNLLKENNYENK